MALIPGTRLGVYDITAQIGVGGMGEVYRATDTNLKRQVAIKVLPAAVARDAERLARFQREAEVLAALNHPNIAAIYGLERAAAFTALVMELVEGEDLLERISHGPISIDEALPIAKQIADALEAAHEQGIIHRDLKPANIKVRADGTVKVLDFGLAKAMDPVGPMSNEVANSPTITSPALTAMGMILGTAAYMSPEQARGRLIDRRTDIWAFGCVLYEVLTARRAFAGNDVSDVLASVLARDADLAALPVSTPPSIRRLLRRCLQKDRNLRLSDMADARLEIADAMTGVDAETAVSVPDGSRTRERLVWLGALVGLALLGSWLLVRRPAEISPEMRLDISTPPTASPLSLAISPDGQTLAFAANDGGQPRLWLRSLQSGTSHVIADTDGAYLPFWSPDSGAVAFFANGKLKRVDVNGGSVQTLANAQTGGGGTWNQNGVILFASIGRPIARVPATGGEPVALPQLTQQGSDFLPQFLPDGRHFLYYVRASPEVRGVYVGALDEPLEPRRLLESDTGVVYASSGHLLFGRQRTLFAQRFDPSGLELTGNPFAIAEGIASSVELAVSVSGTRSIVYRAVSGSAARQFVWFERSGKEVARLGEALNTTLSVPSLSPDGQRVALYRSLGASPDLWTFDVRHGVLSRLTSDPADDVMPVWSPDGRRIVFGSNRSGTQALYMKPADGGEEQLLYSAERPAVPTDWSADGRFVLFGSFDPKGSADIWALAIDGRKAFPVVQTGFDDEFGQFSPDGKWIAYQSNESGRAEVYVQSFPDSGHRRLISTNGGAEVRWSRDGKEIFYIDRDGRLTVVPIRASSTAGDPDVGAAVPLFTPPLGEAVQQGDYRPQYTLSADGQRILIATVAEPPTAPISVILNWKGEPKR